MIMATFVGFKPRTIGAVPRRDHQGRSRLPLGWLMVAALGCGLLLAPISALAQDTAGAAPSGLAAVAAIENALVSAIAGAEKSVVAIARVKRERDDAELGMRVGPFGQLSQIPTPPQPGDANFIPNDFGAGVVVDRKGLILTHFHVVGEDSDLYVTTSARRVYKARIKAADARCDLAVLSIEANDLTPIKFGDASGLKKGQIVIALGNPYAIARDGQASASWGIVSNIARKGPPAPVEDLAPGGQSTLHQFGTLIQTDAKLNLGASGGALIDLKGEMVGLLTATAAFAGYEQSAGYAVPVDETFRRVIETLKQGREVEFGFLGIHPVNLRSQDILAGKHGIRVDTVVAGTPAQRYGLEAMDIITHVNGQPIYDADGLMLQVGKSPVDAEVKLTIKRDEKSFVRSVVLTKFPYTTKKIVTTPAPAWRGMRVDYAVVADRARAPASFRNDVLVKEVESDSAAWTAGLRPSMHIKQVGDAVVTNPKQFHAAVAGKSGAVTLVVSDGADVRTVTVAGVE
jgi:serine protease Do